MNGGTKAINRGFRAGLISMIYAARSFSRDLSPALGVLYYQEGYLFFPFFFSGKDRERLGSYGWKWKDIVVKV